MGQATWQGEAVSLNAGVARSSGTQNIRLGASGGLAWMDGSAFASRRIDGGLALVQLADYANVRVRQDNQLIARTDAHGRALLSGLRGYEANRVGIDSSDLPFDAELEALEVVLTPSGRSASRVSFPVQRSRAATFHLVDAKGQVLPPGTLMTLPPPSMRIFPVGLDGLAYVAGLTGDRSTVRAQTPAGHCQFELQLPTDAADLPDLGTLVCK